ncbi:MAG: cytochrome P460 family protein [Candidatus Acidiferrales bacterium]
MKSKNIPAIAIVLLSLSVLSSMVLVAQQDRYTVKALNGVAFSEFKGYQNWQDVAVSQTDTGIKAILGNRAMINAYKAGIPGNGKPFPDGAEIVKIEWNKTPNPVSPYSVNVPGTLKSVSFIEKDSKRFPDTSGWGYAQFLYDAPSKTFKPFGSDASFGKTVCYQCHTIVKARDYIFTNYPPR